MRFMSCLRYSQRVRPLGNCQAVAIAQNRPISAMTNAASTTALLVDNPGRHFQPPAKTCASGSSAGCALAHAERCSQPQTLVPESIASLTKSFHVASKNPSVTSDFAQSHVRRRDRVGEQSEMFVAAVLLRQASACAVQSSAGGHHVCPSSGSSDQQRPLNQNQHLRLLLSPHEKEFLNRRSKLCPALVLLPAVQAVGRATQRSGRQTHALL